MESDMRCQVCKRPIEMHRRSRGPNATRTCADCFWKQRDEARSRRVLLRGPDIQRGVYRGPSRTA